MTDSLASPDSPGVPDQPDPQDQQPTSWVGDLIDRLPISPESLDKLILLGLAILVLVVVLGIRSASGYPVTFDSQGGSDVPAQRVQYGDRVSEPPPPSREGYTFVGWSTHPKAREWWDFTTAPDGELQLYAIWASSEAGQPDP